MSTFVHAYLSDGTTQVSVHGKIDERFDDKALRGLLRGNRLVLDLSQVTGITSMGLQAFTRCIDGIKRCKVVFVDVSPVLARQLCILPGLFSAVRIESARLPFSCPRCGNERDHTVPFERGAADRHAPCCTCGSPMELDGIAEQYLP